MRTGSDINNSISTRRTQIIYYMCQEIGGYQLNYNKGKEIKIHIMNNTNSLFFS